ncbi:hypothetical protein BCF58_0308 [Chryseobacterium defluvii]|uniref:Uncharacterized protein n=1 Tax=Chryseobacterium defluvii TaxID=160396 RepID=A0A495SP01_9FLAO|nr:hypothetical protein BCF58_0308 [Chryseobacterium defluvii]
MKLKHIITGLEGVFVREIPYYSQFHPYIRWIIKLDNDNGKEYFAPKNEFTII